MGKKDKVRVAAIQIQYPDGDEKQLSVEDARELFKQLEGLFGEKIQYIPGAPVIIERDRYPWRPLWTDRGTGTLRAGELPPPTQPLVWCCEQDLKTGIDSSVSMV